MTSSRSLGLTLALLGLLSPTLSAQVEPPPREPNPTVRLFLDCQATGCRDMDFFRTEIQFVNWVRDRRDSDVHLLITAQATGAGGRSYDLLFMGLGRFEGMADTLTYVSAFDATPDELRRGMADIMKIGLMRYVGLTSVAREILIGLRGPGGPGGGGPGGRPESMAAPEDDPWDFWVFRLSTSGYWSGESTYSSGSVYSSVSANRVTEEWKTTLGLTGSFSRTEYDLGSRTEVNRQESYSASGVLVKSLGPQWSAGLRAHLGRTTRYNQQLSTRLAPVLEYNFFPYAESTRRQLTAQYSVGLVYYDYEEETIFDQTEETRVDESLDVSLSLRQPWGTVSTSVTGSHYLHNAKLHNLSVGGSLNLRLFRGFSLNLGGTYARVQDQLYIIKGDLSEEDILLRRRALRTDYYSFLNFGLQYSFGSIFNNVVNPRIGGGGSSEGMIIIG